MRIGFIFLFLICSVFCFGQKKLSGEFGLTYRMTPINLNINDINNSGVNFDEDKQLSGFSPFVGLSYPLKKTLLLNTRVDARYDHLYYKRYNGVSTNEEVKKLISDITFEVVKLFPAKKGEVFFQLGAGYCLMNNGTNYSYTVISGLDGNGNPIYFTQSSDFRFAAVNLRFGYTSGKHSFLLKPYYTITPFKNNDELILLEFSYSHSLKLW